MSPALGEAGPNYLRTAMLLRLLLLLPLWERLGLVAASDSETCPAAAVIQSCSGPTNPEEYLDQLIADGYDRSKRPPCGGQLFATRPTIVEAQFYLSSLSHVDMKLGIIVLNGYMRTWWKDQRLAWNANSSCFPDISLNAADGNLIWKPDLYVDNLVQYKGREHMSSMTAIYSDGSVWRSEQVLVEVKADLDLGKLPFDTQLGKLVVGSYSQDTSQLRLKARGGRIGPGKSGVGLVVGPQSNMLWGFGADEEEDARGFETAGEVTVRFDGTWDFLEMIFPYSRKNKFFVDQVIFPSIMLMGLSYVQFFVDPNMAPARATLSVIPILIMREMINSVYLTLPEGSQQMWLSDFLSVAMFICVAAAMQMGLVQFFLVQERRAQARLVGLQGAADTARKLVERTAEENIRLIDLFRDYAFEDVEVHRSEFEAMIQCAANERDQAQKYEDANADDETAAPIGGEEHNVPPPRAMKSRTSHENYLLKTLEKAGAGTHVKLTQASKAAAEDGVKECSMLFISYGYSIFSKYDADQSNAIDAYELRKAFTYFDIYMSSYQLCRAIVMFLHDVGLSAAIDPFQNKLSFSQFTMLLLEIDHYKLMPSLPGNRSMKHLVDYFQRIRPSQRVDILFRVFFPLVCIVEVSIFFMMLPSY